MNQGACAAAAVNWLWLAETEGRDRALVIAEEGDSWRTALRRHFLSVENLTLSALRMSDGSTSGVSSRPNFSPRLMFDDQSFDCVLLPGFIGSWNLVAPGVPRGVIRAAIIRECRRLLRRGGVLLVSGRNPQWYGGLQEGGPNSECSQLPEPSGDGLLAAIRRRARQVVVPLPWDVYLADALTKGGFESVHTYFADPSDMVPRAIIPACRSAAMAYERQDRTMRGRAPRLLTAVGLHALAYPARLVLAFA
jgi:SAM-dependent methyltransferase